MTNEENPAQLYSSNSALIIAHPGHELRVYDWIGKNRPLVYILTDGSGSNQQPRLKSTTRLLKNIGGRPAEIYGKISDLELYEAIRNRNVAMFQELATELAACLIRNDVELIVGDAEEGEIMAHDLWRGVRLAAVAMAQAKLGHPIRQYDYVIEGAPDRELWGAKPAIRSELDDDEFAKKIAAAREYIEIAAFVDDAVGQFGSDTFRQEFFYDVTERAPRKPQAGELFSYEQHGRDQVAKGIYPEVIEFQNHLAPVFESLGLNERKRA